MVPGLHVRRHDLYAQRFVTFRHATEGRGERFRWGQLGRTHRQPARIQGWQEVIRLMHEESHAPDFLVAIHGTHIVAARFIGCVDGDRAAAGQGFGVIEMIPVAVAAAHL